MTTWQTNLKPNRARRPLAMASGLAAIALALTACSNGGTGGGAPAPEATTEWNGVIEGAAGDTVYMLGGEFRGTILNATCMKSGGVLTLRISEPTTGNAFTTTQPSGGSGVAGGTLTLGSSGKQFTWVPVPGVTVEQANGGTKAFENEQQEGYGVIWDSTGVATFVQGFSQRTTEAEDGYVAIHMPGRVDCSQK